MSLMNFDPLFLNMQLLDPNSERSVGVLKELFGQPIVNLVEHLSWGSCGVLSTSGDAVCGNDTLLTMFIGHYNAILIFSFLIIYSIVLVMAAFNTAHDGKIMGQRENGLWTPLKIITGPMLAMPIHKGFCAVQFLILYAVLVGVQMGTYVWRESIADVQLGYTPTIPSEFTNKIYQATGQAFLYSSIDYLLHADQGGTDPSTTKPKYFPPLPFSGFVLGSGGKIAITKNHN